MTGLVASVALRSILGEIGSSIGRGLSWITESSTHLLIAACGILTVIAWGEHHEVVKAQRVAASTEARRVADNKVWAGADRINHGTIKSLVATLDTQSGMVRAWADAAEAKQQAAQAALRAATARGEHLDALARRIDAEAAQRGSGGQNCRSGDAVMAAKNEL